MESLLKQEQIEVCRFLYRRQFSLIMIEDFICANLYILKSKSFTNDFIKLKKDFVKKVEELRQEKETHRAMEAEMVAVCQELGKRLCCYDIQAGPH